MIRMTVGEVPPPGAGRAPARTGEQKSPKAAPPARLGRLFSRALRAPGDGTSPTVILIILIILVIILLAFQAHPRARSLATAFAAPRSAPAA